MAENKTDIAQTFAGIALGPEPFSGYWKFWDIKAECEYTKRKKDGEKKEKKKLPRLQFQLMPMNDTVIKQMNQLAKKFPPRKTVLEEEGLTENLTTEQTYQILDTRYIDNPDDPDLDGNWIINPDSVWYSDPYREAVYSTQYRIDEAVRLFGNSAEEAVKEEFRTFFEKKAFHGVKLVNLTQKQRKNIMKNLTFLTQKSVTPVRDRLKTKLKSKKLRPWGYAGQEYIRH